MIAPENVIKVLLADADTIFLKNLRDSIGKLGFYSICAITYDGREALEKISQFNPELILLSLSLPEIDGFGVIEAVRSNARYLNTRIILFSSSVNDFIVKKAYSLNVDYFFLKPISMSILIKRIGELMNTGKEAGAGLGQEMRGWQNTGKTDIDSIISSYLNNLHIHPNISGYYYLRSGIRLAIADYRLLGSLTKKLYPKVAEEHNCTAQMVERSMRHAIESGFKKADISTLESIFGYTIDERKGKPTNGEFIALIAEKIRNEISITE